MCVFGKFYRDIFRGRGEILPFPFKKNRPERPFSVANYLFCGHFDRNSFVSALKDACLQRRIGLRSSFFHALPFAVFDFFFFLFFGVDFFHVFASFLSFLPFVFVSDLSFRYLLLPVVAALQGSRRNARNLPQKQKTRKNVLTPPRVACNQCTKAHKKRAKKCAGTPAVAHEQCARAQKRARMHQNPCLSM